MEFAAETLELIQREIDAENLRHHSKINDLCRRLNALQRSCEHNDMPEAWDTDGNLVWRKCKLCGASY